MPNVQVELLRKRAGVPQPWDVNADGTDPVADSAARATLVSILAQLQAGINALVSGTVNLSAGSLAALESITAIVSGTVELGPTSLAALETINAIVTGQVSLDPATITSLKQVTATISGVPHVIVDSAPFPADQLIHGNVHVDDATPVRVTQIGGNAVQSVLLDANQVADLKKVWNQDSLALASEGLLEQLRRTVMDEPGSTIPFTVVGRLKALIAANHTDLAAILSELTIEDFAQEVTQAAFKTANHADFLAANALLTSIRDYLDTVEIKLQSELDKQDTALSRLNLLATESTLAAMEADLHDMDEAFYRLSNDHIPAGYEVRLDLGVTDLLMGYAVDGTATSAATWNIMRIYLTAGSPTRKRVHLNMKWDDRLVGSNWP